MRAAVVTRYGGPDVVQVVERPQPEPGGGEVLVRVHSAPVTSGDARIRGARFPSGFAIPARLAFGITRPRRPVLGNSFSGVVEAVGADVGDLTPGDEVCAMTGIRMGAHATHLAIAATKVARKPAGVSHDDAAGLLFGGTAARHFLDHPSVVPGASVLVIGASGAVGTNAVQLARLAGASVTGVTSEANAALVTDLGAERTIDHNAVDVTATDERFDVVVDTVGILTIATGRRLLRPGGALLLVVAGLADTIRARGPVVAGSAPERVADYEALLDLVANGTLRVVLDGVLDLDEIVDAHRRVDSGRKVGNLVIRPG